MEILKKVRGQTPTPMNYNPNSGQFGYDYSLGNSYGASYGEDDLKDSDWLERQNRGNGPDFFDDLGGKNQSGHVRLDVPMQNETRFRNDNLRLRCEITGYPIPKYQWFKDDVILKTKDRVSIKITPWGSRLRIRSLTPDDSGMYGCRGWNSFGSVNTTGYVQVKSEVAPNKDSDYDDVNMPIFDGDDAGGITGGDASFKGGWDPDQWKDGGDIDGSPSSEQQTQQPFCQQHRANVCATYVGNKSIYVTSRYAQGLREDKVMAALSVIGHSNDLSTQCGRYAISLICHFSFPHCEAQGAREPVPWMICKDECEMLENQICREEYVTAKHHQLIDNSVLPSCKDLPDYGTPCVRLGVPIKGYDDKCYKNNGANYRGMAARTKSGKTCQNWNYNSEFPINKPAFSDLLGDHNLCRNPNGTMTGPWCYTDPYFRYKELCDVPVCASGVPSESSNLVVIIVPGIIVPLVLIILLALVCFCQRSKRNNSAKTKTINNKAQNMELCPLTAKAPTQRVREFPLSSVRFLQELGEGAFGKVYKGEVMGLFGENTVSKVAIKTLKENAAPKTQNDFRREVDMMSEMRHPNIVCLLGVVMKQEPMCMLFEFMSGGDLHEYLIQHSPHSDMSVVSDEESLQRPILDYGDMLHISTQIASGMEYLASHHFVHRDLAARNILVGDNLTVKISDFGLSRDVYSSDYYRVQSKSLLPVRWMPPEAIMYGKFTTESDIWAFGVVLWETFSYGLQPYYGFSNQEVIEMIRSRQILPSPEDCPARMYGLMVECWHEMPTRRPNFREVHARLRAWKSELLMQNPHWSLSQSHSAHSSSHQSSLQSGPSQQGSTGPSNTTAMTGLTGSSNNSDPDGRFGPLPAAPPPLITMPTTQSGYPPNPGQQPVTVTFQGMPTQKQIYSALNSIQQQNNKNVIMQQQPQNTNGPTKISPPESVASGSSSGSSTNKSKIANSTNSATDSSKSPPPYAECNRFNNFLSQNAYIPEQRTAEI
ncbi:inactive tyrosine-protein kinase transmembrane receptor ROR1-like isoform X2 [Mya arenaria]|uniref:inactive tyrosine-protein kinase transmembrane receptor ROR1-like isoform X2 n=1 Tax=Mya arenaria TaxID=6604 RepID=UPI0022E85FC6|nr:inactive tyrosine-protein kinase transmembrane receptor ROR1-like isoform X2 [Mya arenaria]